MIENENLNSKKDSFEQEFNSEIIKNEEISIKNEEIDYSNDYELPTIKTRYFSIMIDSICIILCSLGISALFEKIGNIPDSIRIFAFVIIVLLYEPIFVIFGCTIGQLFTNIRVRNFRNPKNKLNILSSLLRFIVKVLLGWLSFLTITFNINKRAIHDFASGSIMISVKL